MLACYGMDGICGGPYEEPETVSVDETIMTLREHIRNQEKREEHLEHKMGVLAKEAKVKLAGGDKKGAVNLLKRRKMYQAELQKIENVKVTLETQAINLESSATTADAFQAMSAGNNTMKKIRNDMGGVENVDDVLMDIQEEMDLAGEVNQAIGQSVDPLMGMMDEDELMKELQEMENADLEQQFNQAEMGTKNTTKMPDAPKKGFFKKSKKSGLSKREEADLKKLEAELA